MSAAIERDAAGQQALLARDSAGARAAFAAAADLYRRSWEEASPTSYGRLVGLLKSAVLAGDALAAAAYAREALADEQLLAGSPTASYARALAALIEGDDSDARRFSEAMAAGGDAFARTARAIAALAARDGLAYADALAAIVRDFEQRQGHLTGVAIADTALMLEQLAAARDMAVGIESPVMPA
jgi:hypothetical protein